MKEKIAIIGGTLREKIVAARLLEEHFPVSTYAVEGMDDIAEATPSDCLKNASVLILPVASNDEKGKVLAPAASKDIYLGEEEFKMMAEAGVIYCGVASDYLREAAQATGHKLTEVMEVDDVAVPNAYLTAEGTLYLAMSRFTSSISDLKIAVLGYGRVGKECVKVFASLGARVVAFSRNKKEMADGRALNIDIRFYHGISAVLPKVDILINTVPALVVTDQIMKFMNPDALIIDLASAPGGIDLKGAKEWGFEVLQAPGIPGKYAPVSAGHILADFYMKELSAFRGGEPRCV